MMSVVWLLSLQWSKCCSVNRECGGERGVVWQLGYQGFGVAVGAK